MPILWHFTFIYHTSHIPHWLIRQLTGYIKQIRSHLRKWMENVSVRGRGKSTYKYRYSRTDSVPRESYSPQESERKASGAGKKGCQGKVWPKSWHFLVIQLQIHPGLSGGSIGNVGSGNGNGARPAIELYLMHIRCSMSESLKPKADKSPPVPACLPASHVVYDQ